MRKMLLVPFVSLLVAGATGCAHREMVAFADHPTKPLTAMNVDLQRSYLFYSTAEYVFYSCSEQGDQLTCKRLCGGSGDIVCPEVHSASSGYTTNIR